MTTYIRQTVESADPVTKYVVSGTERFSVGVDTSDSNTFKINNASTLADTSAFAVDLTSGDVTISNDLTVGGGLTANSMSVTGDVSINGDFTVSGVTTFVNTEITTIEDQCIQLALSDTISLTNVDATTPGAGTATVTTANNHNYANSDYLLIQGVDVSGGALTENINKVHQISNITATTFQITLVDTGTYTVSASSLTGKVSSEANIDGAGIKAESHNAGTIASKSITYNNTNESWRSNINFDIENTSHTFSIAGIDKVSNTLVGTLSENFTNVYSAGLTSASTMDIDATGEFQINSSSGSISIGNDNVAQSLSIGNAGARTIIIGNTSATVLDMDASGAVTIDSASAGISLDAATASNFTTGAGALTLDGNGGVNIVGNASEVDVTTSGALDLNLGAGTWDASTLSLDATDSANLTMTSNDAGTKTLVIAATNTGAGVADVSVSSDGCNHTISNRDKYRYSGRHI